MFSKTIIDSDAFLDMPLSSQCLYFHLSMRADDDGFINNPRKIQRMVGASDDDFKLLLAKNFIISFESGVVVIKHWKIHNYIQSDRYRPTTHVEEKNQLEVKVNKSYTLKETPCIHDGYTVDTQVRLDKVIDRDRVRDRVIDIESTAHAPSLPQGDTSPEPVKEKEQRHKYGQYGWVILSDAEYTRLLKDLGPEELERCIAYIDESAQSNGNKNKWKDWNLVLRKCHRQGWGLNRGYTGRKHDQVGGNPFLEMLKEGQFDE